MKTDPIHVAVMIANKLIPQFLLANWVDKEGKGTDTDTNASRILDAAKYTSSRNYITTMWINVIILFGAFITAVFTLHQVFRFFFMMMMVMMYVAYTIIEAREFFTSAIPRFSRDLDKLMDSLTIDVLRQMDLSTLVHSRLDDLRTYAKEKLVNIAVVILKAEEQHGNTSHAANRFRDDFKNNHEILLKFGLVEAKVNTYFEEARTRIVHVDLLTVDRSDPSVPHHSQHT